MKTKIKVCNGYTQIVLPSGQTVCGLHAAQPGQEETAARIGCSVELMNKTHDVIHVLLAEMIGLEFSPLLQRVADGLPADELRDLEEDAVIAIQRFAQGVGKLEDIANKYSEGEDET